MSCDLSRHRFWPLAAFSQVNARGEWSNVLPNDSSDFEQSQASKADPLNALIATLIKKMRAKFQVSWSAPRTPARRGRRL